MIDVDDADWLRAGAWDIWTRDDPPRLVTTLEERRRAIGADGPAPDAAVRHIAELPAGRAMPADLRAEVAVVSR